MTILPILPITKSPVIIGNSSTPTMELRLKFCHSSAYTGPVNSNMYTLQQAYVSQAHTADGIQLIKTWKNVPVVDADDKPM